MGCASKSRRVNEGSILSASRRLAAHRGRQADRHAEELRREMTRQRNQSTQQERNVRQAAKVFNERGWRTVRLRSQGKVPYSTAWQNADPKPEEFGNTDNIGVQLGAKSGHLVDIDFDSPEARALSGLGCFFGDAPSFRRSSLPETEPGHRLVVCADAPDSVTKLEFSRAAE